MGETAPKGYWRIVLKGGRTIIEFNTQRAIGICNHAPGCTMKWISLP